MRIGIIGAGRIGGNLGRWAERAGHEVLYSFSRDQSRLAALADGERGRAGSPAEAARFGEVVVLAVPWPAIDEALAAAGDLGGAVVVDATNPFGAGGWLELGTTVAEHNSAKLAGARYVRACNTLTASFQGAVASGEVEGPVAMFVASEDSGATQLAAPLVEALRFVPVDLGGWGQVSLMEAPRRPGAVYGEAYRPEAARRIAAAAATDLAQAARLADELKLPG